MRLRGLILGNELECILPKEHVFLRQFLTEMLLFLLLKRTGELETPVVWIDCLLWGRGQWMRVGLRVDKVTPMSISGATGKESVCQGRRRKRPGSGISPGEGNDTPLQDSCLKIPWAEKPGGLQRVRHEQLSTCLQGPEKSPPDCYFNFPWGVCGGREWPLIILRPLFLINLITS